MLHHRCSATSSPRTVVLLSPFARTGAAGCERKLSPSAVALAGVAINLLLAALKLGAGLISGSAALIADAGHVRATTAASPLPLLHRLCMPQPLPPFDALLFSPQSCSDLLSDGLCLAATRVPAWERGCTLAIAALLAGTGAAMISSSGELLWQQAGAGEGAAPAMRAIDLAALLVALISVASKEWLFRTTREVRAAAGPLPGPADASTWTRAHTHTRTSSHNTRTTERGLRPPPLTPPPRLQVGERLHCKTLVANAQHHRSDAMSSVAAILGIGGSIAGFACVDSVAAVLVGGMVLRVAFETAVGA